MTSSRVHFHWNQIPLRRWGGAVSLHSHTLHSRERLDFIGRSTAGTPWLSGAIRKQEARYRALSGRDLDLSRAWWTPPLSALRAWQLEKSQIENLLDCEAMVSLTDHDNIDAGLHLSMLEKTRDCPISVEWTVPWRETFFHLGLHNLPTLNAGDIMRELEVITANPSEDAIATILDGLHSIPQTLVVMNHPVWDEKHIGSAVHARCVESFLTRFKQYIHALELNGLRPWNENIDVIRLASDVSLPLISGGDRHAREPNACVNLTNAATFAEFVDQIRQDGRSDVLFMPQYREAFKLRIVQNICDVLEDDPDHSLGWTRWSDRVFYLGEDGSIKSLHELWGRKFPPVVNHFVGLMSFARHPPIRSALRTVFHRKQKFAL